jgi:protoheme IX farnesyltransferase
MLVTLTTLLIAGENIPSISILSATMVGCCLSGAGAGALNSYLDRDIDALMQRTRNRPLPAERIEPRQALRFGIALCILSLFVLGLGVNLLAAAIAFVGFVVYVVIYTYWLKRRSMANIFFAGAAWAIPSLVGWAASTGSLTVSAISLFAILFYWTPINLWALGLVRLTDYTRAGMPILPVIKGSLTTRKQLVYYSILMIFLTLLPALIGLTDFIYAEAALLLGGVLVFNAFDLFRHPGISGASRLHKYSIVYLVLLFSAMMLDRTILN